MVPTTTRERRRRQRIDIVLPIKIEYNRKKILATTRNISVLGTYLEIDQGIPIGTILFIKIKIPKTGLVKIRNFREVDCSGIAFRCQRLSFSGSKNQYGVGIFFRSFSEKGESELSDYIEYILQEEEKRGKIFVHKRKRKRAKWKGGK